MFGYYTYKMDSFEINKIIAAIIITVLIVFGIGKISDFMFKVEQPSVAAYKVEATDVAQQSPQLPHATGHAKLASPSLAKQSSCLLAPVR